VLQPRQQKVGQRDDNVPTEHDARILEEDDGRIARRKIAFCHHLAHYLAAGSTAGSETDMICLGVDTPGFFRISQRPPAILGLVSSSPLPGGPADGFESCEFTRDQRPGQGAADVGALHLEGEDAELGTQEVTTNTAGVGEGWAVPARPPPDCCKPRADLPVRRNYSRPGSTASSPASARPDFGVRLIGQYRADFAGPDGFN
jgi:hypothetical protein